MAWPPDFIEEVKNRHTIADVVGQKVKLTHKSGGEFMGLCPFHKEKTPSFTVSNPKGFYHCFGCGAHGNVIDFVMETEGRPFTDAVKSLAEQAGMAIPEQRKVDVEQEQKKLSLYDLMQKAAQWFEHQLYHTDNPALSYLERRGVDETLARSFQLGYAPGGYERLKQVMISQGFTEAQLLEVGLLAKSTKNPNKTYDRFRDRLMFPISDAKGRVIAFGGRILGDGQPKYLNSPEGPLFHKGHVLYNLHRAQDRAYKRKAVVAVEGYMDVIALHKVGITNVVAPLGTALTESHMRLLWKMAMVPVLCMDGDKAGLRAMHKAALAHLEQLKPGYSLAFCTLPQGQDPDDFLQEHGVEAMRELLVAAKPLSDVLWSMHLEQYPQKQPEQRAMLEKTVMALVERMKDDTVKYNYRDFFKTQLWQLRRQTSQQVSGEGSVPSGQYVREEAVAKMSGPPSHGAGYHKAMPNVGRSPAYGAVAARSKLSPVVQPVGVNDIMGRVECSLLLAAVNHPWIIESHDMQEEFVHLIFITPLLQKVHDHMVEAIEDGEELTTENFQRLLEEAGLWKAFDGVLSPQFRDPFLVAGALREIVQSGWNYILAQYHHLRISSEYDASMKSVTDDSLERVMALQQHKDEAAKRLDDMKNEYLAVADD